MVDELNSTSIEQNFLNTFVILHVHTPKDKKYSFSMFPRTAQKPFAHPSCPMHINMLTGILINSFSQLWARWIS